MTKVRTAAGENSYLADYLNITIVVIIIIMTMMSYDL